MTLRRYYHFEDINIRYLDFNYENSKGHALSQVSQPFVKDLYWYCR